MNKLLPRTCHLVTAILAGLAWHALPATGQTASSMRSADFIVAVVNSEPVTNSEVQAMRVAHRCLRPSS
jgi:hypothetical protein